MQFLKRFFALEASSGILLLLVTVAALIVANSALAPTYEAFAARSYVAINDGLMVIFFLLVGLEIKRETMGGALSTTKQALLPLIAATGGVILPAIIFLYFNAGLETSRGWAIASATDIAFSLGVLSLFGRRVPIELKIFLMAVAVIDDLMAILIIAFFYSGNLAPAYLAGAVLALMALVMCNRAKLQYLSVYFVIGLVLWFALLKSGVHPTIAGVLLAFAIPVTKIEPLIEKLHPWVAFGIMPLFAFANAGVSLDGVNLEILSHPLTLGIIAGLFVGKQLGIFTFSLVAAKCRIVSLPKNLMAFYAVSILAGIGFTMSLFIGNLAFVEAVDIVNVRLGVLAGSLLSALIGLVWLAISLKLMRDKSASNV